jgi:hypothetical protein
VTGVEFAAWTTGVLAMLGILGVLYRLVVKLDRVERASRELVPNGGSSIKDAVHRIEGKVDDHGDRLAVVESRLDIPRRRRRA